MAGGVGGRGAPAQVGGTYLAGGGVPAMVPVDAYETEKLGWWYAIPNFRADDYAYMLRHSRAQAVLVSGALWPVLQDAMARGAHEVATLLVSQPTQALAKGAADLEKAIATATAAGLNRNSILFSLVQK